MMAIKLALEATIITMIFIGIMALLISLIKQKNICPICGDPCRDKFCCEAHELLHYSEGEFSTEDWLDAEEDEALAEQREMEREERIGKALP